MVGQTRDAGWQVGVSKTIPYPLDQVWSFMSSAEGIALWLGPGASLRREKGSAYETDDGITGEVRGYHDRDRIRITRLGKGADHETTMQFTVVALDDRTTLTFHEERLADADERERRRTHWQGVLASVLAELEG